MADEEESLTSTNSIQPRIVYIRLGKDKTEDAVQNEIFKGVRKALKGLESSENDGKQEKNVVVLPDFDVRGIQDVAMGGDYVCLLLRDGRVCRFKCLCRNIKPSTKRKASTGSEEQIFQVQSDEAYARRLQEQMNVRNVNVSSSFGSSGTSNTSEETVLGLTEPPFRFGMPLDESNLLESAHIPTGFTSRNAESAENLPEPNFENLTSLVVEPVSGSERTETQNIMENSEDSLLGSTQANLKLENSNASTNKLKIETSNQSSTCSDKSPTSKSVSNFIKKSSGSMTTESKMEDASPRLSSKSTSNLPSSSTGRSVTTTNARSSSLNSISTIRENVQTTLSFLPRRPPHSPTVVHRTILTADPILLRTTRPVFIPSHVIIPSFPQASTSVYTFDPRRLNTSFSSRTPVRVLQRSGRRQLTSPYEYRRNRESNALRRDRGSGAVEQNTEDSGRDFHYPDIEEIEWLQTESGESIHFSHIGALHTEFILVEKHNGILYHWPYTAENHNIVDMETELLESDLAESIGADIQTPKAKLSPLIQELKLEEEQVTKLATHGVRCTLVTKSGKICTFYDKFMRECNQGQVPALIQQLSHPAVYFSELKGDSITSVDCSEFFSCVMTQKGKIYWWGLLPSKERQDFKQKLNKESSNNCSISVNDKVQLRKHLPGFPGALIFKSSETYGPQLGRLLSHETEEGTSQSTVKIKVERVPKIVNSQPNSGCASPVINLQSKIESPISKGAASPLQLISQEVRSSSPHTSIRNQSRPETTVKTNPNVEMWDVNDVVFLESESKVLGTVAAIDGPHVIVKVDNVQIPSDSSLRVFKVSELETVTEGTSSENQGASTSKSISSSTMYRGCIQRSLKCILDASRPTSVSEKEVLTGIIPLAMAATSTGVSVLVRHKESNKAFFIGPAIDSGSSEKVFTCCADMTLSRGNDDACVTVEAESVASGEAALITRSLPSETIGQKRRHSVTDNADDYDTTSSGFHPMDICCPSLHTSPGSGVILLCDSNSCLYPRPFGTKLSEPCAVNLPPLHCFGIGQKLGYTSKCETEEKILMVFLAFKEQKLIQAIQSGIVAKVQDVLDFLERICLKTNKGKTALSSTGVKRLAQEGDSGKAWSPQTGREDGDEVPKPTVFNSEVMSIINEHTSSNQNVLHVCCTNPAYLMTEAQEKEPVEALLAETRNGMSNSTSTSKHIEVAVLDKLLHHKLLSHKFISMLKDRDAKGCTPFLLSIQCHNFKAALYILDFVSKHKGKQIGDCKVSLDTMIFPPTFSGITPLHALALACTENLPASGLGNSLTVSNLPSGYTPRILLKLFQSKYPSAYRATIPPLAEAKKYPRAKTPRQRLLEKAHKQKEPIHSKMVDSSKKTTLEPIATAGGGARAGPGGFGEGGNRIPIASSRRESLQGMVTFSDPKELRQALIEMDKHMVSSETVVPEGGLASLVQHVLHVKLTELGNDDDEKLEMEVGIRGGVYNVSTSSGTAKISRKTQTSDAASNQHGSMEDDMICQLFARLLSHHEMATAVNKQEETVLSFFVNNSRWIKLTAPQKQRLLKYSAKLIGSQSDDSIKQNISSTPDQSKAANDITAEIKFKGSNESSTAVGSNLLAQLDEISSSFKSLVDTLAALEGRVEKEMEDENMVIDKPGKAEGSNGQGASSTTGNLIDFSGRGPEESVSEKDEVLPILIQLAQNWSCVATTILGYFPELTREGSIKSSHGATNEGLRAQGVHTRSAPSKSCSIDGFIIELLANADKSVLISLVETIIKEMNKYPQELLMDVTQQCQDTGGPYTPSRLAITVGMKFLRAVVRQMSVHLSRSGVSYVDLRSRLASNSGSSSTSQSSLNFGSDQNSNVEFKQKARMILKSFSWFGIYELVQAAEATIIPVREGVAKAQAKSTGASISNNVPTHTVFPGGRYRGGRPGIRVSQYDSRSTNQEAMLRTASRIPDSNQTTPVWRCQGTRLASLTDDPRSPQSRQTSSPPFSFRGYSRRRTSIIDSDSDTDEETGSLFRNILDEENEMDIEDSDPSSVTMATGLSIEHPYAWALDGRLFGTGENSPQNNLQINFTHYINNIVTPPSVHTGNCYLTRMYSRLVKEAIDLTNSSQSEETSSSKDMIVSEEPVIQVLAINPDECCNIQERVTSDLEVTWVWLARVLDVVEGQLQHGEGFDTKRYLATLQRPEESDFTPIPRTTTNIPGSTPEEYLMFLLRSHTNEHNDTLPVIDMLCYEHVVYILDSFIYCTKHWTKSQRILDRSMSSISSIDGEEPALGVPNTDVTRANTEAGIPGTQVNPRRRRNKEREDCIKFYGMNVTGKDRDEFLNNLQATLQQKSRMLVPKATWEVFTHNVGTLRMKSVEEASQSGKTGSDVENALPVTFASVSRQSYPTPLVHNWSADEVIDRWKISVDLFSRLFLADGPGAERDSFLAARAGVAGRLARFRRTIVYLRESVTADSQQGGLAFGGLGGRVGTTLSIAVKRIRLLEDTLRILGEMQPFHYSNFRAKFEGEEGSGPGVNRGFFAAVANALKAEDKLPPETTSLLHEPGKLPEQSGFYASKPFAYRESTTRNHEQLKARRHRMFTAIGRFLGLSLWFNNTVPLNFSRHVIKFLLDRDVTWEDLIFFNADLFEGLSRMMIDAAHPLMTSERFQATYCCHFETSVGGTTEELLPDGSQIPVTPSNIFKYVRLYATKVMVGCVEEELRCMRNGLHDVIPTELLATLSPEDFQLLLSGGTTDIDISKLRSLITFTNSNGCSKDILERFKRWFWSIVQKMTPLQRQQLLYFCTGSAVLPVMNDRRDPDQDLSITVDVISGNTKALPMATTCGQRMSIPLYPSKRILKKKLLQAIQCQSYGLG